LRLSDAVLGFGSFASTCELLMLFSRYCTANKVGRTNNNKSSTSATRLVTTEGFFSVVGLGISDLAFDLFFITPKKLVIANCFT
jgi:hypothetical protein